MWKNYNRFYTQILKTEAGYFYLCKNVNQIPSVKKVSLTCVPTNLNNSKNIIMALSALQLIVNKKARLVTARDSVILTKVRKGQPLGAKIFLTSGVVWQFIHFLTFNLMPRLDLTKLLRCKKKSLDFKFFVKSPSVFNRLIPFFKFFQFLPPIQVVFTLKRSSNVEKIFFWRLLKLPVSFYKKGD